MHCQQKKSGGTIMVSHQLMCQQWDTVPTSFTTFFNRCRLQGAFSTRSTLREEAGISLFRFHLSFLSSYSCALIRPLTALAGVLVQQHVFKILYFIWDTNVKLPPLTATNNFALLLQKPAENMPFVNMGQFLIQI